VSLLFPRNPLISVWFAQGRQKQKRKGVVKSSGLQLAICTSPRGMLALWQKVAERSEPATVRFQFTIQGSAMLLEKSKGASRSKA